MKVRIFSAALANWPDYTEPELDARRAATVATQEQEINDFLEHHQVLGMQWLQTSASSKYGSFTQLTLVVTYKEAPVATEEESGGTLPELLKRRTG